MPGRPGKSGEKYRATIEVTGPRDRETFTRFKQALDQALRAVDGTVVREGKAGGATRAAKARPKARKPRARGR
jgi:hypothetical protein